MQKAECRRWRGSPHFFILPSLCLSLSGYFNISFAMV
jgi:hypothetical protein